MLNPTNKRAERSASSFPGVHFILRAGRPNSASHASHRTRITERDSWVPTLDLCCRRWRPAKLGGAPYRQLCPAYPFADHCRVLTSGARAALVIGRKAAQERFSEESFRNSNACYFSENVFLKSSTRSSRTTLRDSRHTPSLD